METASFTSGVSGWKLVAGAEVFLGKAEETRQAIIEKAAVIFNKNGYQRTSMAMLCDDLGLSKGAIYGHFADKDALAVEAFLHSVRHVSERVREKLQPCQGEVNRLRAFAATFLDFYRGDRAEGRLPDSEYRCRFRRCPSAAARGGAPGLDGLGRAPCCDGGRGQGKR